MAQGKITPKQEEILEYIKDCILKNDIRRLYVKYVKRSP